MAFDAPMDNDVLTVVVAGAARAFALAPTFPWAAIHSIRTCGAGQ